MKREAISWIGKCLHPAPIKGLREWEGIEIMYLVKMDGLK